MEELLKRDRGFEFVAASFALHAAFAFLLFRHNVEIPKTTMTTIGVTFESEAKPLPLATPPPEAQKKIEKQTPKKQKPIEPAVKKEEPKNAIPLEQAVRKPEAKQPLTEESHSLKTEPKRAEAVEEPKVEKEVAAIFNADYLKNPPPAYPSISRRLGEEGRVLLKVRVLEDGTAASVTLQKSSGFDRLDESALNAVKNWKFVPAKKGNQNISSWVVVPIVFSLSR